MTTYPEPDFHVELEVPVDLVDKISAWSRRISVRRPPDAKRIAGMIIVFTGDADHEKAAGGRCRAWLWGDRPLTAELGSELEIRLGRCNDPMMTVADDPGPEDPLVGIKLKATVQRVRSPAGREGV